MRRGILAAILLSTWATTEAAHSGASSLTQVNYAGTWRGRTLNRTRDTVAVNWTWVNGSDGTGSITFANEMIAVPTRLVSATTDSVVFELLRPLAGPDSAMLRYVGRPSGDSIVGDVHFRVRDGRVGRRPFDGVRVGSAPAFERKECAFAVPATNVECGWLLVPESRSRPEGRIVRLNVVVARATRPTGEPPRVTISGGPGQPGVPTSYNPGLIAIQRDVIYYDQRGTGSSQPSLCPEFNDSSAANRNRMTPENFAESEKSPIRQCVDSLRAQGIDREAYNTSTSAHDLADLRRALGYKQWILRGGSYGTRLAQETMRQDPLGVHSAVLVAPVPPGEDSAVEWRLSIQRTLEKLFAACAADASCHSAFPDPEADFYALWESLNREPIRMPAANSADTVILHGGRLVQSLVRLFDGTTNHARIPLLLHELRRGDRLRAARELAPNVSPTGAGVAVALNRLVNCYESGVRQQSALDSANTVPKPPFRMRVDAEACRIWRTQFAGATELAPLRSDIPTLIITGEYDLRTPAENARLIARTLSRASVVVLPGMGHSGLGPCGNDIVRQFLENATRELDLSCLTKMPKLAFATAWPATRP